MTLKQHQDWLVDFYKRRDWYKYSPFIRLNFLTEEVGELSRAIRAIEIGRDHPGEHDTRDERNYNLHEELADVMDQVLILCDKYQVDPDSLMAFSEAKLKKRFNEQ
ncbi:MazG nucleotide pyrophosphohydrolase domain-containing protein [Lentilactobacillus buchneri]|uniref:Pyrophosphohydrolase n=1 Tax=Lentilactobacillus buchneri subsp. silagei CD034 TaxID=1071400 RepID=J9W7Q7_LENBU|nr:MazG-like family protein [Lentilactobacillus buchneri]MCC6101065.1 MazG-like family protein [Lactobacillus sp.]AFS00890.1 pyrophosphohydrolase [Lentilactobacillus buchneri subsp. silagei CD034]MCT2899974.1 hypothetical protein [Lentilactobacillus buchneri]MCT3542382.1 hypothetical protein [Lentilactobacillus buchneri]MCT3545475.1 hypothetical protein [Lentilactobacillus buchneri]